MPDFRWLDLFSGIGGFALGLGMAGFPPPVAFCEIEPFARKVLAKHWLEVPCHEDVRALSAASVGPVDLIAGGFPCQDVSCAGKGRGVEHGERSGLWREMFRLIRELMPRWVLAENVPALRTRGADLVIADLEAAGYAVWPVVVGAWAVGAPHKRDRVWIVGRRVAYAKDCGRNDAPTQAQTREPSREAGGLGAMADSKRARLRDGGEPEESDADTCCELADSDQERRGKYRVSEGEERRGIPDSARRGRICSDTVALTAGERQQEPGRVESRALAAAQAFAWPAGRGAEQHAWEAPRVLCFERAVGSAADGLPGTLVRHIRGFIRAKRGHNRDILRAAGNAVVPQVVAAIGRAILEAEMTEATR